MADERVSVTIVFKNGERASYRVPRATAEQIASDFVNGGDGKVASYDVLGVSDAPVILALRFFDVLYIG